jgi:hypothetical protein
MKKLTNPINLFELSQTVSTCACFNLRKASRVITQHFDEILKPSGLLVTQFTMWKQAQSKVKEILGQQRIE